VRWLDRVLRDWRASKAAPWVRDGDRVLDLGSFDASFLRRVEPRIARGIGVDPLAEPWDGGKLRVLRGSVPGVSLENGAFDCITMLAVLEHIPDPAALAAECAHLLAPGGRVVITVPRPAVDRILSILKSLRLIDGMSLQEHRGYDVEETERLFSAAGLRLIRRSTFQLGLNCLFVFERPEATRD
jgi:SAM-dependent methyltransferase